MQRLVGFDTETHLIRMVKSGRQKKDATYIIGTNTPRFVVASFCVDGGEPFLHGRAEGVDELLDYYVGLLSDPETHVIAHNAAFDLAVMIRLASEVGRDQEVILATDEALRAGRLRCTMIREKIILNARGWLSFHPVERSMPKTSLEACVRRHLNEDVEGKHGPDAWRLRYAELDGVPTRDWPLGAQVYAALDAQYALRVFEAQVEAAEKSGYELDENFAMPTEAHGCRKSFALTFVSNFGIKTNYRLAQGVRSRVVASTKDVLDRAVAEGLYVIKTTKGVRSYKQNQAALRERLQKYYDENEIPAADRKMTPKGDKLSLAGEVLEVCINDPLLLALGEVAADTKILSAFTKAICLAGAVRVCPRYSVMVETERAACSSPNVMQQPRRGGVRETHVPTRPDGDKSPWVLISCDYSAQELGTLAQVCYTLFGYSKLRDTLNAGKDPHIQLGKDILAADIGRAVSYDEAYAASKGKHEIITKSQMKGARQTAKAGNFGFPGGMGIEKFILSAYKGYGVRISKAEASRLKQLYLSNFPEIREYFNWISQQGEGFTLKHPLTGMLRGDMRYTAACNSCFQHLASVITTSALYRVAMECITEGTALYGCRLYAFIHDEIIISAPLARCHEAAERVSTIMVEEAQRISPDVKYSAPPAAAYRWYKAMEDVRDENGRLVPWVPNARDKEGEWQRVDKLEEGWTWATPPELEEGWFNE